MELLSLHFAWFLGHIVVLFSTISYCLSFFGASSQTTRWAYRTHFLGVLCTWCIVLLRRLARKKRVGGRWGGLGSWLHDENVLYIEISVVWRATLPISLAIVPATVYAVFHLLTTIQKQFLVAPSRVADDIDQFIKKTYDEAMALVAGIEIILWGCTLVSVLLEQKDSGIQIFAYSCFLQLRWENSSPLKTIWHYGSRFWMKLRGESPVE